MLAKVSTLMHRIAFDVMEDDGFSSGLWTVDEVIGYIDLIQREFIYLSQSVKQLGCVSSSTSTRIYDDPADSMQLDRIAFAQQPMLRTQRKALDLDNPAWKTEDGKPGQYHQDQLTVRTFEVNKKPISGMTGSGYTVTGSNGGLLRGMSGSRTYAATGNGTLRRMVGTVNAYNVIGRGARPYGLLRRMRTGLTNFETVHTLEPGTVSNVNDSLVVQSYFLPYLQYGVLSEMYAKDGHAQDMAKSNYCRVRFIRGVNLLRKIMGMSPLKEEPKRRG